MSCRRCQADLTLLVGALRHTERLLISQADSRNPAELFAINDELLFWTGNRRD